jgi:hypothetical protein
MACSIICSINFPFVQSCKRKKVSIRVYYSCFGFRVLLTDSTQHLKSVAKKTGTSVIEKARPYYEATEAAKKAQKECQSAATAYQRAFGVHAAAKVFEILYLKSTETLKKYYLNFISVKIVFVNEKIKRFSDFYNIPGNDYTGRAAFPI